MKRRTQRANQRAAKAKRDKKKVGNYAKKRAYLNKHGGMGFEYPEPKPWK